MSQNTSTYSFKIEITGEVTIGSIRTEDVVRTLATYTNAEELIDDGESYEVADRNRALLKVAVANSEGIRSLVIGEALALAQTAIGDLAVDHENIASLTDIIRQLIPSLSPEDGSFFASADKAGVLLENCEHFLNAFTATIVSEPRVTVGSS